MRLQTNRVPVEVWGFGVSGDETDSADMGATLDAAGEGLARLLAELEATLDARLRAEDEALAEAAVQEVLSRRRLSEAMAGRLGSSVVAEAGGHTVAGSIEAVNSDSVVIRGESGEEYLVALGGVAFSLKPSDSRPAPAPRPASRGPGRLPLQVILRGLGRRRVAVTLTLLNGRMLSGTVEEVGADYLEIAELVGVRPASRSRPRVLIGLGQLAFVRVTPG